MKELEDKDFDQIFKNKIKDGYLEYEEESWLKMEKKLRRRGRFVFYRNASIILVFLSFGIGIYLASDKKIPVSGINTIKKAEKLKEFKIEKTDDVKKNSENLIEDEPQTAILITKGEKNSNFSLKQQLITEKPESSQKAAIPITVQLTGVDSNSRIAQNQVVTQNSQVIIAQESTNPVNKVLISENENAPRKTATKKLNLPITLSINVGPDFNSTENAIGGKGGMAVGLGISVALNKKLSLQTGVNYGSKNYEAKGYDYAFNNPNTVNIIDGIDASCKVLELPLRASYTVMDNSKNSIDLNAGLSSYIMLKENYRFIYTTASGRNDRFLEEKNANQHYLSVIDLSATYNMKLKNKKFALGLQPYVKIPISGIGEGSVPLKSSGISLKLNYELNKKK